MTTLFGSIEQVLSGDARCCLQNGDCIDFLRTLPDCSVDSIVDDPPAGISFMGTEFDSDKGGRDNWIAWLQEIARESLRVLKPGGYHITWALPRTSHWTATAIENAGFEIRDIVTHVFGSGFPKSLNLSLAIDKQDGVVAERQVVHSYSAGGNAGTSCADKGGTYSVGVENSPPVQLAVTRGATEKSRKFDGFGTALKPASEHWIIARKPLNGTLVTNALMHGTGALNIDACRVTTDWNEPDRPESWKQSGHTADTEVDKIAAPPGNGIRCHPAGRWPTNFVLTHDYRCIAAGESEDELMKNEFFGERFQSTDYGVRRRASTTTTTLYDCVDGCPVKLLNEQSWDLSESKARVLNRTQDAVGECVGSFVFKGPVRQPLQHQDSGGASRFFNTFEWHDELDDVTIGLDGSAQCKSDETASSAELNLPNANQLADSAEIRVHRSSGLDPRDKSESSTAFANSVVPTSDNTPETSPSIALSPAQVRLKNGKCRRVKSAENQSTKAETTTAQSSAGELPTEPSQSQRGGHTTLPRNERTQILSHARDAEVLGNIGTIQTIQNPNQSSGYVEGATSKNIISVNAAARCASAPIDLQPYDVHWYCPKPSAAEREAGCDALPKRSAGELVNREDGMPGTINPASGAGGSTGGRHNHHPTLKSIALMTHFVKLATPPGGVTVSRFLGSGTDACAALLSGFRCIGFEKEPDYFEIAKARVVYWARRGRPTKPKLAQKPKDDRQTALFPTLEATDATP